MWFRWSGHCTASGWAEGEGLFIPKLPSSPLKFPEIYISIPKDLADK